MTTDEVREFRDCIEAGGVALFPSDTVYGLAAAPERESAVRRLYEIKGRSPERPAAVMFFDLERALATLRELGPRTRAALRRLLPGPVTVVLVNREKRYPLACGPSPERLGVRVPELAGALQPLGGLEVPVLQSSANRSGGVEARRLEEVDRSVRSGVDLELDAGELPGTPSTVVDLSSYEEGSRYEVLREGAVPAARLAAEL
ncbi:MAG TPA: L-threonylcarbamoyladenylate synthase [Thermoleophilaceae bacterium]|nr:L-threonylcarbamoyladenylate synthase [Thermoleophilaceae bacterium]